MTIACATHFTDSSQVALRVAAELARRTRQSLLLASVLPGNQRADSQAAGEVARHLESEASTLRAEGLDVKTQMLSGALDTALSGLAATAAVRLLVLGDPHGTARTLLATPLDRAAYGSGVPVLVVRSGRPFEAWARREGPLRVMLAMGRGLTPTAAHDWVLELAEYGLLDVVATHVWSPGEEYALRGLSSAPSEEEQRKMERLVRADAEAVFAGVPSNVKHRVHLEVGTTERIALLLNEVAAREQADLIVLGTHPRMGRLGALSSVCHGVLSGALMSVAFIPEASRMAATAAVPVAALERQPATTPVPIASRGI